MPGDTEDEQTLEQHGISRKGHLLYEQELRQRLQTENNVGKIIVFDVETGNYEIDVDGIQANKHLRKRFPDADPYNLFAMRVGYDAVFAIGSTLTRTAEK